MTAAVAVQYRWKNRRSRKFLRRASEKRYLGAVPRTKHRALVDLFLKMRQCIRTYIIYYYFSIDYTRKSRYGGVDWIIIVLSENDIIIAGGGRRDPRRPLSHGACILYTWVRISIIYACLVDWKTPRYHLYKWCTHITICGDTFLHGLGRTARYTRFCTIVYTI